MNRCQKIMVCITEDWFAVSHFLPLLEVLKARAEDVILVTNCTQHQDALERDNVRIVDFDFHRADSGVLKNLNLVGDLRAILAKEQPDVLHLIAMKPIVLAGLASKKINDLQIVCHVTGLGFLASPKSIRDMFAKKIVLGVLDRIVRTPRGWLVVENPDDQAYFQARHRSLSNRPVVSNGSGLDLSTLELPTYAEREPLRVGMACRLLHAKGVADLVAASELLRKQGVAVHIDLYGDLDSKNRDSVTRDDLARWNTQANVTLHGHVEDRDQIWRNTSIAVVASREREGLPRSLLEAAARGLAIVATDVPGNRYVVRNQREGLLVPPRSPPALAAAIARLANDEPLRRRLGQQARKRVGETFSVANVQTRLHQLYEQIAKAQIKTKH